MSLWPGCKAFIKEFVSLAELTTLGIGGRAEWLATPASEGELSRVLAIADGENIPVRVLGGGSNLLISDGGVPGLVIRLREEAFKTIRLEENCPRLIAGAGVSLTKVIRTAVNNGLGGLEALAGIPGTIGGAAVMNAGTGSVWLGRRISAIHGVDFKGQALDYRGEALEFGYRFSNLKGMIVTRVECALVPSAAEALQVRFDQALAAKTASQPVGARSAGCYFLNPEGDSAGRLIDAAGCKGMRVGGAAVSEVHANFLVSTGKATCAEMEALADEVAQRVKAMTGIQLEMEIQRWP